MERRAVKKLILLVGPLATIAALVCLACLFFGTDKDAGNIILISIDTIRADHVSSYGYPFKTTPRIDAFADKAVLFENCFSNIPLTMPAHASMLTGVIPPTHGVQDNMSMALSDSVLTLPEILRAHGYATYGIISAEVLNKRFGLDQGFDVYDDTFDDETSKSEIVSQRFADETAAHSLEWLEENRKKKKFMFIHFYDPHSPFEPPDPYDKQFKSPYDGEIAFVDHCIGLIVDKLKSLDQYDDSLIVITGDHAQLLNEHGEPGHGFFIYHNVLRVPLVIKPVGHSTQARVADNTSLTDIVPTILAQSGIEIPPHIQGVDLSDYLVRRNHHIEDRYIFNESLTATKYNGNSLLGVINNQWHYIQTTRPELYNRIEDPQELNNLIGNQPHRGRILQDQLSRILAESVETRNESAVALDYESRKALESLGYVSGAVDSNLKFDRDREDPKDLLAIHIDLAAVMKLTHQKQFDKGIELCNKIIARRPDIAPTYKLLADIYVKLESYDKAIQFAKKKLALLPGDIESVKFLAQTHRFAGNYRQAIDYINTILKLQGDAADTYYFRARNYHHLDDTAQALQDYLKALQLDPEYIPARIHAGEAYEKAGKLKQAIEHYEIALRQNPNLALKHNIIAWTQATQKDPAVYDPKSALKHAEKAVELARDKNSSAHAYYPHFLDTLAVAHSANGQFDAAIETASLALKLCRQRELVSEAKEIKGRLELYKQRKAYRELEVH